MTDDLKQIKDLVEIVVKKVRGIETGQNVMVSQIRTVTDQQSVFDKKLDVMQEKLGYIEERQDGHTASLMNIEATLKGYADMYKVNKDKNEELEERVDAIEDKVGISKNN